MNHLETILAVAGTIWERGGVCAVASIVGVVFILTGISNISSGSAQESGARRLVNESLGKSNDYEGQSARSMGWLRVVCGIAAIGFGIYFLFTGPTLAD